MRARPTTGRPTGCARGEPAHPLSLLLATFWRARAAERTIGSILSSTWEGGEGERVFVPSARGVFARNYYECGRRRQRMRLASERAAALARRARTRRRRGRVARAQNCDARARDRSAPAFLLAADASAALGMRARLAQPPPPAGGCVVVVGTERRRARPSCAACSGEQTGCVGLARARAHHMRARLMRLRALERPGRPSERTFGEGARARELRCAPASKLARCTLRRTFDNNTLARAQLGRERTN